ncbi:hypothetical protein [Saccharopolyspora shandongensis]|uniref:hypothetical protein n=1 Tax=Saccharopolyspora shandongensis TaxID=418495 RepID=UPI0033F9615D
MGTVYFGPYAEEIDADRHEGYAARILPDGTETATWTASTREFRNYVARCSCGWRGTAIYKPDDNGEQLAYEEWDHDHLRPLVDEQAGKYRVPASTVLAMARRLRQLAVEKHSTLDGRQLTERGLGLCDAADELDQLLDSDAGRFPAS